MNNIVYQDNQSAIRIYNNGSNSCTSSSRHINIMYFSIKEILDKEEVKIYYCPSQMMLVDYFTNHSRERC